MVRILTNTRSGKIFDLLNPKVEDIVKSDILYSLEGLNRYIAQTDPRWSVLRHSLACAIIAEDLGNDKATCLCCLYHDTGEAYTGDIHGPLKELFASILDPIETGIDSALATKFNLPTWFSDKKNPLRGYVKYIDYLTYHGEVLALDLSGHDLRKVPSKVEAILVDAVNLVKNLDTPALLSLWETMEGRFRS